MQTHIDLFFGDGDYTFALKLPQIIAIEDKCGPIGEVFARLLKGRYVTADGPIGISTEAAYRHADLVEIVRQGLIGGGTGIVDGQAVEVTSVKANQLVAAYVLGIPLTKTWDLATAVLSALIEGYEPVGDDQKKSSTNGRSKAGRGGSTGPKSSQTAQ